MKSIITLNGNEGLTLDGEERKTVLSCSYMLLRMAGDCGYVNKMVDPQTGVVEDINKVAWADVDKLDQGIIVYTDCAKALEQQLNDCDVSQCGLNLVIMLFNEDKKVAVSLNYDTGDVKLLDGTVDDYKELVEDNTLAW